MEKIGIDKAAHFFACLVMTCLLALTFKGVPQMYGAEIPNCVCGGIGAAYSALLGIGKELFDYLQRRKIDCLDLLADILGITVGFLLCLLM